MDDLDRIPRSPWPRLILALLVLGGLGVGAFYGLRFWHLYQDRLATAQDQASTASQALGQAQSDETRLAADLAACKSQGDALSGQLSQTGGTLQATQVELDALRAQQAAVQARLAAYLKLAQQLKQMTQAGKISVRIRHGKMVVNLPASVLFDSGSAVVSKDGVTTLGQVATALATLKGRDLVVAGHTDDTPIHNKDFASNWELSSARAVAVEQILETSGLDPRHLAVAGYAQYDPVESNGSGNGRAENRRIEIVIMPNLDELPKIPDDLLQPASQPAAGEAVAATSAATKPPAPK